MILVSQSGAVLAGAVLALLVLLSGWALFAGLRAYAAARMLEGENARLNALGEAGPAQPLLVRADGEIEMPPRLAEWLGLDRVPRELSGLSQENAGATPEDAQLLARHVTAAQRAGRTFRMTLRPQGAERALLVVGDRAPEAMRTPAGALLWFLDATESEQAIARLTRDTDQLHAAFDAMTALIEAAPMPMWYRGSDLRLLMVNSAYVRAVEGRDGEDVVARGLELVEGGGLGGPLANAAIARDTAEPQIAAMPATVSGARRMLRLHDVPLPTGGVAGFAVDVEELEQARVGLKRFGEAQRAMLDRVSGGVAQFGSDRGLVFCNQAFRRMFAMKNEWLADRPEFDRVLERMREVNRLPDVRDFPTWKNERREWFTAPEAVEETWSVAGTHLRVVAQPLPEGGLLLLFEDRTQQLELQREHGEMQQVRTATLESLAEAVAVFSKGRLQLWNRKFRQVWGFEDIFLDGHPQIPILVKAAAPRLANPNRAEVLGDLIRIAAKDRQQRGSSIAFADGRHFDVTAVPLPDGNALVTMLDTTDHHRAESALRDRNVALEAADRVKTAFVANMSYELRTPLTSIKGFSEMLHGGFAGKLTKSAKEYTEAILTSVDRLGNLIDDVLDLTQSEGAPLEREHVELAGAAKSAADSIASLASGKRIELVVEDAGSAGSVTGDSRRLRQTIEHLLRHAVAATPEEGRVLLHLDGNAKVARIIVSDNGPGMSPKAVAKAFDSFAQHGISRSGERALGLGLPLAKQFVEAHGGRIQLISEPGEGTLVTVELPR
ncbi:PAS domain-containing sensor histidine kinase [Sphingomonas xinjiangensis]|uniref:histidine kinase n=1 Tax=Sphingomonas xinjiangensis TaxID=643568 RepID=A0A840YJC7_9SPHN|nr:HAMP domain-containing sensor histidine kinase [Sphingomonas xinjiangensis]MBB5708946.1 signal transduction histidine kinase [Sphingomonas xinjiangensis]